MEIAAKFVRKIKNYPRKRLFKKLDHYKVRFIKTNFQTPTIFFKIETINNIGLGG